MGGMAHSGAFRADGGGGGYFIADSPFVPAAGSVLGAHNNRGDHAVVAGGGAHCFLATLCRNISGSGRWRDCGALFRTARVCIRCLRFPPGTGLRLGACGSKRIPFRRYCAGNRAVDTADAAWMGDRFSPVRRGFHRNWGGADIRMGLAGEGSHTLGVKEFFHPAPAGPLYGLTIAFFAAGFFFSRSSTAATISGRPTVASTKTSPNFPPSAGGTNFPQETASL